MTMASKLHNEQTSKHKKTGQTPTQKWKVGKKIPNVSLLGTKLKNSKKQGGLETSGLVSKGRG